MTDDEYNIWFGIGYDAASVGDENPPTSATADQRSAWQDGYNTAQEEM